MKRKYTDEFRKQAVELAASTGSIVEAARQLGISDGLIHAWKNKFGDNKSLSLNQHEADELRQLRKENTELKKINYILKRAAAFFSQDQLK